MNNSKTVVRQSVSLPINLARRVRTLAKSRRTSANQVLVDLIELGIECREGEKERFFALTEKLIASKDVREQEILKAELAKMTFGN